MKPRARCKSVCSRIFCLRSGSRRLTLSTKFDRYQRLITSPFSRVRSSASSMTRVESIHKGLGKASNHLSWTLSDSARKYVSALMIRIRGCLRLALSLAKRSSLNSTNAPLLISPVGDDCSGSASASYSLGEFFTLLIVDEVLKLTLGRLGASTS